MLQLILLNIIHIIQSKVEEKSNQIALPPQFHSFIIQMLNKLLQKTRNAKLGDQTPTSKSTSQSVAVSSTKQNSDAQKDSYLFSANSVTQIQFSSQQGVKQQTSSTVIQQIPPSLQRQSSPVSKSLYSPNQSLHMYNSHQPSARSSASVNIQNNQFANSVYNSNNLCNLQDKQKTSVQISTNNKQQLDVAQENSKVNTPQTIKFKSLDAQNLSIQRVAVNLSNIEEFKEGDLKKDQQKQLTQAANDFSQREQELQGTIKSLQTKIQQLVKELEKQTNLSNQALEDNSLFRKKYQELKENSSSKQQQQQQNSLFGRSDSISSQQPNQSDLIASVQMLELQEENKKLKQKFQQAQLQASQWREKYENQEKLYEQQEENLKEKIKDQYQKEIQALNNELNKYKQQSFGINKSKKVASLLRQSNSNNTNNMLKENNNNNNQAQYSDDWHQNYMILKEEKEKSEKMLKKRIESLEEQNAFLQNEVNQLHQKNDQLQGLCDEPKFTVKQQYNYNQDSQFQNRKSNNLQELNYYFSQNLS
ncbi:hypothetical protein TTHERM_00277200 (macronuclear) [Tetrahymena thermophila SB210]|uniref:Uncharacterized protein n=1 Tax=Tetrahymena thermophila (strain SB210) TaxID=312017 RepID=I7M8C8_TETTS|nr:hypothetical protein TTHERM_00277200 [Tetrahymena thermophila SB210]EAR97835.2 hypothetical protein TTHERM_00277200 [Tetrahymena thermophila SB210]|eukprot:XP_001018080.2 hypothetical protein TTHERM_00277200 [Tetrahymena thermophila SB210]